MLLDTFAKHLTLGSLLEELRGRLGGYELVTHWQQGEFHHDTVLRVDAARAGLPGPVLVVATNCNGGIKEVLCFAEVPTHGALWQRRCPGNNEFQGVLPELLGHTKTLHWFDPCELLIDSARSEYREEFRERQSGGGWRMKTCGVKSPG
jgi:hypothetical protein